MVVDLLRELTEHRLLVIVRQRSAEDTIDVACGLIDLGIRVLEISLTSAGALEAIRSVSEYAESKGANTVVGAGTVLTQREVHDATSAGAKFAVTPALGEGFEECIRIKFPVLAGALTPTEIIHAWCAGAAAVKVFPASTVSADYVSALRGPFPSIPLVPVGGVDAEAARRYLSDGAIAVGVGSPLTGDAGQGVNIMAMSQRLAAFIKVSGA